MIESQIIFSLTILVCVLATESAASVQHVAPTNRTANHSSILSNSLPRKLPISDTLIVHLITSAPTTHHYNHNQKSPVDVTGNQSQSEDRPKHPAMNCTDGTTFWDPIGSKCVNCSADCPSGAYVGSKCNQTHDLECLCPKGSYMSVVDRQCKACAACPFGSGVWRTCRWSRNTVCRKCQPGTYSGVSVGTLGCIPCSKCGPKQEMINECDGNRDTVCVDRVTLRHRLIEAERKRNAMNRASSQIMMGANRDEHNEDGENLYLGPTINTPNKSSGMLYICIVFVIVFTLSVFAFIRLMCTDRIQDQAPSHDKQQFMCGSHHHHHHHIQPMAQCKVLTSCALPSYTMSSPYYHHTAHLQSIETPSFPTVMHLYTGNKPPTPGRSVATGVNRHGSSGSGKSRPTYKTYYELLYAPGDDVAPQNATEPLLSSAATSGSQAQQLTVDMIEMVEQRLGNDSISWKMLARELGYEERQIGELETKSTQTATSDTTTTTTPTSGVDSVKAIRLLLTDWCQPTADKRQTMREQTSLAVEVGTQHGKSSVAALVKALTRIGRVDCVRLLLQHHKPSTTTTNTTNTTSSTSSCSTILSETDQ